MSILKKSLNVSRYKVVGLEPEGDFREFVGKSLQANAFRPIDNTCEELSIGWVHADNNKNMDFGDQSVFIRDQYVALTMRVDERKVPARVLRAKYEAAVEEYLAQHPGLKKPSKHVRDEIKEAVRQELLKQTIPVPTIIDAVWDTDSGMLMLFNVSKTGRDRFESLFKASFAGFRAVLYHPYALAEALVASTPLSECLAAANRASSESVLELIEANTWLGEDFFSWLLYQTANEASEYKVSVLGDFSADDGFVAYVGDRVKMVGASEGVLQKIAFSGPQYRFSEIRTALCEAKRVTESVICFEKQESYWQLKLDGQAMTFSGYKTPSVVLEKGDHVDERAEEQAAFYEKMQLLEQGIQLFESLFLEFLSVRLGAEWSVFGKALVEWAVGEASVEEAAA